MSGTVTVSLQTTTRVLHHLPLSISVCGLASADSQHVATPPMPAMCFLEQTHDPLEREPPNALASHVAVARSRPCGTAPTSWLVLAGSS